MSRLQNICRYATDRVADRPRKLRNIRCPVCDGKRFVSAGGQVNRCPVCRSYGVVLEINYKID